MKHIKTDIAACFDASPEALHKYISDADYRQVREKLKFSQICQEYAETNLS